MPRPLRLESNRRILFCLFVLAVVTAVFAVPFEMRSTAVKATSDRTESYDPDLPNYDIRTDKTAGDKLVAFRTTAGKDASQVADTRDAFVRGESALRQRVPTLKIEYNSDLRIPEVIGPDVKQGRGFLSDATTPSGTGHANALMDFLRQNTDLVGVDTAQVDALKVVADYTNPDGNLSFVELNQEINGIPVFRGEVKAGFTRRGEMIRVINNLAPAMSYDSMSSDFGDPLKAVRSAAALIHNDTSKLDLRSNTKESTGLRTVFGTGMSATTAEKMYFPTEPGVARAAWRVLIWQPANAYYVIVDAQTGTMLWRKNITQDQTQSATYNVYVNPNATINVAHNPFPFSPGPTSPNGVQGGGISRTQVTLVGNEPPYQFNNNGWINDGVNTTDGNANQAGLDRDDFNTSNGVDANGSPVGNPNRVFDFPINPGIPTNPALNGGDSPLPSGAQPSVCSSAGMSPAMIDYQRAAVTQLFYINNRYHDETYLLGFTEQAHNFQQDNFGRGGVGGDRVSAEAQDCSGTNNANFGTPADGNRGRMQMYLWTGPTPDFDGDLDADVIIHEHTHGLSNRLHGNASGLSTNMSGGMGEGWSDFYGVSLLSQPDDPVNGIYTTGGYDTYRLGSVGFNNNYYGIRRFPYAVMAFTGGPNNRPHNPMTFADIDSTQINLSDGAYPPRFTGAADEVHNLGEVWATTLWEVRGQFVSRLGGAAGNRKTLQLVTDGMKLAPLAPTFLTERDAILAAAQASALAPQAAVDVSDVWRGFAIRGLGASATIQNTGGGGGTARVTEAFDLPNLYQQPNLTISDVGGGNGNGFPEPGETLSLTIPLTNSTGNDATGVTLQVLGGGSTDYGTIANGATVTRQASYTVPANTPCGTTVSLTLNVNSSLGATSFTRTLIVGQPAYNYTENFDSITAPALPTGWTAVPVQSGINFVTATSMADTAPNALFAADPSTTGGGSDLTSPAIAITAPAATISFRNNYNTEAGWDGGVLEISIAGGAFQDILAAGGAFIQNGYNDSLGAYTNSNDPIEGRSAWTGNSGGFVTTIARLPAAAAGQNVQFKWRFGADNNTGEVGWWIDTIKVAGSYSCATATTVLSRADFDGDGKSDISVFRPADGNWYLERSTQGFTGVNWGLGTDILTPGDFDGDRKTDVVVFRPSNGYWYGINSSNGSTFAINFGQIGDIPQVGDFDGDGKDDLAVFRPSNGTWYWRRSSDAQWAGIKFGQNGDVPVVGDYTGDGKADLAVFRSGIWYRSDNSGGNFSAEQFGLSTDMPVPADYDGDNKADIAVFRPSDGNWYVHNSSNGQFAATHWGQSGDVPVPGDYDGDGKDDPGVFRGGIWYVHPVASADITLQFGLNSDIPVLKKYIP
jgi:hypothetical protein